MEEEYTDEKCEHHRIFYGAGYCSQRKMGCLSQKYGSENIKQFAIMLPYDKQEKIFECDGKLEKGLEKVLE